MLLSAPLCGRHIRFHHTAVCMSPDQVRMPSPSVLRRALFLSSSLATQQLAVPCSQEAVGRGNAVRQLPQPPQSVPGASGTNACTAYPPPPLPMPSTSHPSCGWRIRVCSTPYGPVIAQTYFSDRPYGSSSRAVCLFGKFVVGGPRCPMCLRVDVTFSESVPSARRDVEEARFSCGTI